MDQYTEAHLFVAAIRVLQHQKRCLPAIDDVCALLAVSTELGHSICRKLKRLGIIDISDDPFTLRLAVGNHLEIEKLPRTSADDGSLARELEQFMAKRKESDKKVEAIQAELKKKKQDMFQDIEAKLKKQLGDLKKDK